jgi:hypothetical protein
VKYQHLVVTRFAIRFAAGDDVPAPAWFTHRLDLLRAYCMPTIAAQTDQGFRWVLLCDEAVPADMIAALEEMIASIPQAEIALTTVDSPFSSRVAQLSAAGTDALITTRLDSDDGLGRDYVRRIATYAEAFAAADHPVQLVCFPEGCKLEVQSGDVYATYQPNSPTVTMFERLGEGVVPHSVYAGNHGYLNHLFPMHHDPAPAPWLQVVHAGNVSNKVHSGDFLLPDFDLSARFGIRPDAVGS